MQLVVDGDVFGAQLGEPPVDLGRQVAVWVVGDFEAADQPRAAGLVGGERASQRGDPVALLGRLVSASVGQVRRQQRPAVRPEDAVIEESVQPVE